MVEKEIWRSPSVYGPFRDTFMVCKPNGQRKFYHAPEILPKLMKALVIRDIRDFRQRLNMYFGAVVSPIQASTITLMPQFSTKNCIRGVAASTDALIYYELMNLDESSPYYNYHSYEMYQVQRYMGQVRLLNLQAEVSESIADRVKHGVGITYHPEEVTHGEGTEM